MLQWLDKRDAEDSREVYDGIAETLQVWRARAHTHIHTPRTLIILLRSRAQVSCTLRRTVYANSVLMALRGTLGAVEHCQGTFHNDELGNAASSTAAVAACVVEFSS